MLAIIVFIIILGLLIFVHELGHFLTARRNGIKAEEFGFGFPPRIFGFVKSEKTNKYKFITNEKAENYKNTVYSLNWIPLGGFVKIKGEDGSSKKDPDSFSEKSAWTRIKVLAAGVLMNFILAWFLISIVMMLGAPEAISPDENISGSKIQISGVVSGSPAEKSGLKIGDEISKTQINSDGREEKIANIKNFQDFTNSNKGKEINLFVKRGNEEIKIKIIPRADALEGEGPLGVSLVQISIVKYPWYEAIWVGLKTTLSLIWAILAALGIILKNLFLGQGVGADVAGPVGIAVLTGEVTKLGLVYIMQFTALLSINLGVINLLPFPALDGGRILFIAIEKIKGRPVSQKVEQAFHTFGFILLIILLILITFKDVLKIAR